MMQIGCISFSLKKEKEEEKIIDFLLLLLLLIIICSFFFVGLVIRWIFLYLTIRTTTTSGYLGRVEHKQKSL